MRRLQRAKRKGDLPQNADPADLARYVMTVLQGMDVQGDGGASCDQQRRVAQMALRMAEASAVKRHGAKAKERNEEARLLIDAAPAVAGIRKVTTMPGGVEQGRRLPPRTERVPA